MPRAAVALAGAEARAAGARSARVAAPERAAEAGRPRRAKGATFRFRRLHALLIAIGLVSIWLVIVFARALGDVDRATARHETMAAEAATLQTRLDADKRELELVQTDAFQRLQARAYGMGDANEIVFSLPQDAPSAPPITPLGGVRATTDDSTSNVSPLDAWLKILFGN